MRNKALILLACGVVLSLTFSYFELALGFSALGIFILQLSYLIKVRRIISGVLPLVFALGTIFCWVMGFLGCLYLLPNTDFLIGRHTLLTMVLLNIALLGGFMGTMFSFSFVWKTPEAEKTSPLSESSVVKGLLVTLAILVAWISISYVGGILTARANLGSFLNPDSILYFTSALSAVQYLFFFFLGAYMKEPAFSKRNIIIILILIASGLLFALPGGRSTTVRILFVFLSGVLFSNLKLKNLKIMTVFFGFFAIAILFTIGYVRSYGDFQERTVPQRIDILVSVIRDHQPLYNNQYDNPLYSIFTRIAEPSGQVVIDNVGEAKTYAGFINFDRISYLYTPKFIDEDKPSLDDGPERLYLDYNVPFDEFTSSPITLLADSYARWGYVGVFAIPFILSFLLATIGRILYSLQNKLLGIFLIFYFMSICFSMYTMSILGLINMLFYIFIRDFLVISLVILVTTPRDKGSLFVEDSTI